jgi:hypothetical protein
LLALCSNPQPGGLGLHIYIPWRLGGPVIPPGTEYPFSRLLRHAWATVGLFFSPVTTRGHFRDENYKKNTLLISAVTYTKLVLIR